MKSFKLSIIIVHFNTTQLTVNCLHSLRSFPPKFPWEVIVVDNGSETNDEELLRSVLPQLTYIGAGKNIGFSAGNNLGIQNSYGEYILLLNSDTKLIENNFEMMVNYMDAHPEIGVLGAREVDGEGKFQLSCGQFPSLKTETIRKMMHYRLSINDYRIRDYLDNKYAVMNNVDWVSGSCMMLRRKALEDAGLFDERFFMYFEDIDLCRRIQDRGWAIRYLPAATICHFGGQSARFNLLHVLVEYRRSQLYFARRYYGRVGGIFMRLFLVAKYGLNAVSWARAYVFVAYGEKERRKAYTMLLLAKKVIGVACGRVPSEPLIHYPKVSRAHPLSTAQQSPVSRSESEVKAL